MANSKGAHSKKNNLIDKNKVKKDNNINKEENEKFGFNGKTILLIFIVLSLITIIVLSISSVILYNKNQAAEEKYVQESILKYLEDKYNQEFEIGEMIDYNFYLREGFLVNESHEKGDREYYYEIYSKSDDIKFYSSMCLYASGEKINDSYNETKSIIKTNKYLLEKVKEILPDAKEDEYVIESLNPSLKGLSVEYKITLNKDIEDIINDTIIVGHLENLVLELSDYIDNSIDKEFSYQYDSGDGDMVTAYYTFPYTINIHLNGKYSLRLSLGKYEYNRELTVVEDGVNCRTSIERFRDYNTTC